MRLPLTTISVVIPPSRTREDYDIPLPDLTFPPAPEPDPETRIKFFLLMRAREQ
jgi:hypothetical protein